MLQSEGSHPGRCQLDRQRDAVQPAADFPERRCVGGSQLKVGQSRLCPVYEQLHRFELKLCFEVGRGGSNCMWNTHRRNPPGRLSGTAERLATGRQDAHAWAHAEQRVRDMSRSVDDVLAVVEDQQAGALA